MTLKTRWILYLNLENKLKAKLKTLSQELDQKKARIEHLTKENPVGKSLMVKQNLLKAY
jgi:hypothetical protein